MFFLFGVRVREFFFFLLLVVFDYYFLVQRVLLDIMPWL